MARHKVYVATTGDDDNEGPDSEPDIQSNDILHKKLPVFYDEKPTRNQRFRRYLFTRYNRLSWSTKQTIRIILSLLTVLYLLFSIPFRIGFLYDPLDNEQNSWTWELTVLTATDVVVDLVGAFEFTKCYLLWKKEVSYEEEIDEFEKHVKMTRGNKRSDAPQSSARSRETMGLRKGKAKWTLESIGRGSSIYDQYGSQKLSLFGRNWELALEIIALLPLEVLPLGLRAFNALHLVRVSKLCRIYKLRRCLTCIKKIHANCPWIHQLSSTGVNYLAHTIALCTASCHWTACGYMFIAHIQCGVSLKKCDPEIESSWVTRDQLLGATLSRKYARSLYWASRTMVIQGYDDVTPVSDAETVYVVIIQVVGALFSSSILATFLFIFRFRNSRYLTFSTHVDNAREYMRFKGIPRAIRHQVIAYFNYAWNTHHGLDSEEALHLMPKHLQSKVVASIKLSRVKQVCFLTKESVEFTNLLALALKRRVYSPTDQIIEPKINAQMFFVIHGIVLLSKFNGSSPKDCLPGDFFAEICLLFPHRYDMKAKAKTFCELYVLDKSKFDDIVTHFYRGKKPTVIEQMADTFERHSAQQRKTQKLLGNDFIKNMALSLIRRMSDRRASTKMEEGWSLPYSRFRIMWDTMRFVALIYIAFEVPYHAVFISMAQGDNIFVESTSVGFWYAFTFLIEVFFGVDIVLRSRYLAYLDSVVMMNVVDPALIFAAYRKDGFYMDLLAWLPIGLVLDLIPSDAAHKQIWYSRLLRLLRIRLLPGLFADLSKFYNMSSKMHRFISLLLGVTLILHVVGCIWFEMAWFPHSTQSHGGSPALRELTRSECLRQATIFGNCSWVKHDCYAHIGVDFPIEDRLSVYDGTFAYIRAVYWASGSITAVGYGDILAFSTTESYFAAVWIFVSGIINFGVVGAMSVTISNLMAPRHHHLELLNTLSSIMERMSISEKLSGEIRRFYNQHFVGRKLAYESQLLANLPDKLCYQISSLLHSSAVKRVDLFDSASIEFLKEVTGKFRRRRYENGETICTRGDVCKEFLVLLPGSRVNVFYRSRKVPVRALHEGDCYGVYEFLLRRGHAVTLKAASTVHASVMTREQFDAIQRKFQDDLHDMKLEAQALWDDHQTSLRRVARNLERPKLKPHVVQMSTLFYQGEHLVFNSTDLHGKKKHRKKTHDIRTTFTMCWKAGIAFWNVYNAFFVLFRIGFHSHLHFSSNTSMIVWITDMCGDIYFAVDIYLRVYYLGLSDVGFDNLVHRKKMGRVYRRSSRFKWDVFASLPLYVPMASGSLAVSLCRLPRLIRCLDLWAYLDDVIVEVQQHFASRNVSAYLRPVKLMIVVAFSAHFVAVIYLLCSDYECKTFENCWMVEHEVRNEGDENIWAIYGSVMHWALATLLQISGAGIVPRDTTATIWTIVTYLGCTFAMGYIVGEITDLILGLGVEKKKYKARVANFAAFANENDIPETLRKRVEYFFRFQFESTESDQLSYMIDQLSANLRVKLMMEIYDHSLARLPISPFLSSAQISNLALRLQSELFIPGDNILVEGTLGTRLCTLRKGVAATFWPRSATSVAVLMEGALFGEVAFFITNQRRLESVLAITSCEVLYVSKQGWEELWTPTGDPSDNQVQKYALHSILDWVNNRLERYQQRNLHIANRARIELAARHKKTIVNGQSTPVQGKMKTIALGLSIVRRRSSLLTSISTSSINSFKPLEVQIREKEAKYLLSKTDKYTKRLHAAIPSKRPSLTPRKRSTLTTALSSMKSRIGNTSYGVFGDAKARRSVVSDAPFSPTKKNVNSYILSHQFILDLNPMNKHVRDILTDKHILRLENECWRRSKLIALMQYSVRELLSALIPPDRDLTRAYGTPGYQLQSATNADRRKSRQLERMFSVDAGEIARQQKKAQRLEREIPQSDADSKRATSEKRRLTADSGRLHGRKTSVAAAKSDADIKLVRKPAQIKHCNSMPLFDCKFLENAVDDHHSQRPADEAWAAAANIDFDVLQRCQRPQYEFQLRLYHRYRIWKRANRIAKVASRLSSRSSSNHDRLEQAKADDHFLVTRRGSFGGNLSDKATQDFVWRVKRSGKIWSTIILVAIIYYVIITPFKICFSNEFPQLSSSTVRVWAGFEVFLDVLCLLDVAYRVHDASVTNRNSAVSSFRHVFASHPGLLVDILAVLPLELLLFVSEIRVSLVYEPTVISTWWATRWNLRINRLLFAWRIEPLTEELLQYLIYDGNLQVRESLVSFLRALASFVAMAHFVTCVWFAATHYGLHKFEESWLSTPGMLTYMPSMSDHEEAKAIVEGTPLSRKYFRSLQFSMQCVTTILYGDIVPKNELEEVLGISIDIWCIYVLAALVGAQTELLNSSAKREASFEHQLAELQLYLAQNEVPKKLKRQIKFYYAHMWRRSRGDSDFAAIEGVSSVLREDIVLAALQQFIVRVEPFRDLDYSLLRRLLVCLQYVVCCEGEDVVVAGDVDRSMYFIATGSVLVQIGEAEMTRERGEFFGELSLLYRISRIETCIAITVVELYRLDHEPYERLLTDFPEYRTRNKAALTTKTTSTVQGIAMQAPNAVQQRRRTLGSGQTVSVNRVEMELPHSFVYRSSMEMLARMCELNPLEAKDIILKLRAGGFKHVSMCLGLPGAR